VKVCPYTKKPGLQDYPVLHLIHPDLNRREPGELLPALRKNIIMCEREAMQRNTEKRSTKRNPVSGEAKILNQQFVVQIVFSPVKHRA